MTVEKIVQRDCARAVRVESVAVQVESVAKAVRVENVAQTVQIERVAESRLNHRAVEWMEDLAYRCRRMVKDFAYNFR